jgi:hypothetical protein
VVLEERGAPEALSDVGSSGRKGRACVVLVLLFFKNRDIILMFIIFFEATQKLPHVGDSTRLKYFIFVFKGRLKVAPTEVKFKF